MKLKFERLTYWAILFQVIATHGVLFFLLFDYVGYWELKKIIHPISFFIILMVFLFKAINKIKISEIDIVFLGYLIIVFITMLFNINSLEEAYIAFREVFFIFILVFIFSQLSISENKWNKILNLLFFLLILNSVFIFLTNFLGPEKYMRMITGRYVWGVDPEYKFKISNFYRFWRSPALIGDAASVGYFSLIAYLLMDQSEKYKRKKFIALFPLIFSFVRSAYLVFFIYEFLKFFTKRKNLKVLSLILKIGFPLLLILGFYISKYDILSTKSLSARFYLWNTKTEVDYNSFLGGAVGNVGGAVRNSGFIATLDSYWLFLLFSIGLIGIVLFIFFLIDKIKNQNKIIFILVSFFLTGFFINLTQSLVFLALFPLFFINIKKSNID